MNIGDKMPDLLGHDADGQEVRISNYPGKKIALYFYPKDNTPGCTAQACSLLDNYQALLDAGYQVIGCTISSLTSPAYGERRAWPDANTSVHSAPP